MFLVWVDKCVCLLLWVKVFPQTCGEDTLGSKESCLSGDPPAVLGQRVMRRLTTEGSKLKGKPLASFSDKMCLP